MNNPVESPKGQKNFEPLTPEEIDALDVITLEDRTALAKLVESAQKGDPLASYYVRHSKNMNLETDGTK